MHPGAHKITLEKDTRKWITPPPVVTERKSDKNEEPKKNEELKENEEESSTYEATENLFYPPSPGFRVTLISRCFIGTVHSTLNTMRLDLRLVRALSESTSVVFQPKQLVILFRLAVRAFSAEAYTLHLDFEALQWLKLVENYGWCHFFLFSRKRNNMRWAPFSSVAISCPQLGVRNPYSQSVLYRSQGSPPGSA